MSLTKVTYSMISAAPYNVLDYASLAEVVNAKSPSDPNSHLLPSFLCWDKPIKAALDAAYAAGGGTVIIPKNTVPYYVTDEVVVKDNTTVVFEDWLILADYNLVGHCLRCVGENITLHNVMIDNSNIFAGGSGYNGVVIVPNSSGTNKSIKIFGGWIKNCARGGVAPRDGGKAVQCEPGEAELFLVDGLTITDCFMALSSGRQFLSPEPYYGIVYNNITAGNCGILLFVAQTNGPQDETGLEHTVQLNNFYAVNCGTWQGTLQFSRASNVHVTNGVVVFTSGVTNQSLIRGTHANCVFDNISWYSNTNSCVNLDASDYSIANNEPYDNNVYNINVLGQINVFADAAVTTPFRTLNGCVGNVTFRLEPAVAFYGYELRNGVSTITMSCNTGPSTLSKTVVTTTNVNFNTSGFPFTFAGFGSGYNISAERGVSYKGFVAENAADIGTDMLFLNAATGKLSYKDSSGVVNALY